ncbi:surface antigen BspA-like [Trichomonas vaginalis G3]|uniref:Surface antigen BspA-like n=1 Tax=Trichomonas vaginalis (strain ATCC PRA-98 / G3) TaxID=412133 RepID=A2D7H2_TRIV3|nr:antigen BSP-related family [Trichomonas vaginalis G3]EAY23689.1 surface antigen BspA-like [Trichomonas vaginalis G3]KAI5490185.1 antigen BSP-related family [Trichomonas vaginalis G3]|eukprot:XP_001276937.1 surface antigen BspA-like [Trichomonas vaginalis G3]
MQDGSCLQACPIISISIDKRNPYYKTDGTSIFSGTVFSTLFYASSALTGTYQVPTFIRKIGNSAFRGSNINKIILTSNVTTLENWCFSNAQIAEFTFTDQITSIGSWIFAGCGRLTSVTLSENIKKIPDRTFYTCVNLATINIPPNLTSIGDQAFYSCKSLKSITLPKTLTELGDGSFSNTGEIKITSLSPYFYSENFLMYKDNKETLILYTGSNTNNDISIIRDCKSISTLTFSNKKLRDVTFQSENPEINVIIGNQAFQSSTIRSIIFPPGLISIGKNAFEGCGSLKNVTFKGNKIKSIPNYCFNNNKNLEHITFPSSIESIGEYAFANCPLIGDIGISGMINLIFIGAYAFFYSGLSSANLANSGCTVDIKCFMGSSIRELTISSSIPQQLCQYCVSLEKLTLKIGVSVIGPYAFDGCTSLKGFIIPSTLSNIQGFAFQTCTSLSTVYMSGECTLSRVDGGCFYECFSLTEIILPPSDQRYRFENGALTDYDQTNLIVFLPYSGVKNFIVPMTMRTIGQCAFMGSPSLIRVFFNGNNIQTIDYQAFKDCKNLNLVFFSSSSIKTIGDQAFDGCSLLRKCGSFSAPSSAQKIIIEQGKIPSIAFKDDCGLMISCKYIQHPAISSSYLYPFISMSM